MNIFYLKKSEFLPCIKTESLNPFCQRVFKSEYKEIEHSCGRFLTLFGAKHFYDVKNFEIIVDNDKPYFKTKEMYFSISHSKDIILVVFYNANVGADVEFMKAHRDYQAIMEHCGEGVDNPSMKEFYQFWTLHEAKIKLNAPVKSLFSRVLEKDYMFTCVCESVLLSDFRVKKLLCKGKNIDLVKELEAPRYTVIKSV